MMRRMLWMGPVLLLGTGLPASAQDGGAPDATVQVQQAEPRVTVQKPPEAQIRVLPPGGQQQAAAQSGQEKIDEAQSNQAEVSRDATSDGQQSQDKQSLLGKTVVGSNGSELGEIDDLLMDRNSGQIQAAIVSAGGFLGIGERKVRVPWAQAKVDGAQDRVQIPMDEAQFQAAPEWNEDQMDASMTALKGQ